MPGSSDFQKQYVLLKLHIFKHSQVSLPSLAYLVSDQTFTAGFKMCCNLVVTYDSQAMSFNVTVWPHVRKG